MNADDKTQSEACNFRFIPFFLKALAWFGLTFLMAANFAASHFREVVLSVFLFSVPIGLSGIYAATIRQIRRPHIFAGRGRLFRLFSGRHLKVFFWVCWGLFTSFFMLVQFHTYSRMEWAVFFLVIPIFWFAFTGFREIIGNAFSALAWSRRLCSVAMLLISVLAGVYCSDVSPYASLSESINARKSAVADMTGSALVQEVSQYLAFYEGVKSYSLGRLGDSDVLWQLALFGIVNLMVFYNACAILSCFLIPRVEYRRVFGPLSDYDQPPTVPLSRIAAISAVTAFLALSIYLPLFCYIEALAQSCP